MKYAKSKNLTVYDVLTIASMIEREAGVPKQRKLVASVIYNRLHEGMPLGIDATIRFATGNYAKPLTESQLASRLALQHAHQHRPAAGPDQQPRPGSDRSRRAPGQDQVPLLRQRPEHVQRTHLRQDRSRIRSRRPEVRKGARKERRQRAEQLRGIVPRPGGDRLPGRRTRARRRCRRRRWRRWGWPKSGATARSRWRRRSFEVEAHRPDCERLRRGSTSPSRTRKRRWRWPTRRARRRGRSAPPTRSASPPTAPPTTTSRCAPGSSPRTPTRAGLLAALPAPPRGRALVLGAGGAARAAIWALVGVGRGGRGPGAAADPGEEESDRAGGRSAAPLQVDVWNRTRGRAAEVAAELGASAVAALDQSAYDLIVNTTAVGLRGEDPFEHLPLAPGAFSSSARPWSTWSTASAPARCSPLPWPPAPPPSTASRSSSAGRPLAAKSGPAARPRSTRCAPPPAPDRLLATFPTYGWDNSPTNAPIALAA